MTDRRENVPDDYERGDRKHGRGRKRHGRARDESDMTVESFEENFTGPEDRVAEPHRKDKG